MTLLFVLVPLVPLVPPMVMVIIVVVVIHSMPVRPVVWTSVIPVVRPIVIPVGMIISVSVIGIAVVRARPKPDSHNSGKSDENLSVRTLHRNESQSTCHQRDQKKLFHLFFPLLVVVLRGRSNL